MTAPMFQRLELLVGPAALARLGAARAAVFGLGGVGSWAAEALVRSGLGEVLLVDSDAIDISNINRQLQATSENVGEPKAGALAARLRAINPDCRVEARVGVFDEGTADRFDLGACDYVLDAIDSVSCKVELIRRASAAGATLYSSLGAAAKLDPTQVRVASIWRTEGCPLARVIRQRLRAARFAGEVTAVFSPEHRPEASMPNPVAGPVPGDLASRKHAIGGTAVHVTAVFGFTLAGLVVQDAVARCGAPGAQPPTGSAAPDAADR